MNTQGTGMSLKLYWMYVESFLKRGHGEDMEIKYLGGMSRMILFNQKDIVFD